VAGGYGNSLGESGQPTSCRCSQEQSMEAHRLGIHYKGYLKEASRHNSWPIAKQVKLKKNRSSTTPLSSGRSLSLQSIGKEAEH
jgi:hypothetical protein